MCSSCPKPPPLVRKFCRISTEKEGKERKETHTYRGESSMSMESSSFSASGVVSRGDDEARLFLCINDAAGAGAAPEWNGASRACRYFPKAA